MIRRLTIYLLTALTIVSCTKPEPQPVEQPPHLYFEGRQTLVVYFMGRSLNRWFNQNINDMRTAVASGALPEDCHLIYFIQDKPYEGHIVEITADKKHGWVETEHARIDLADEIAPEQVKALVLRMVELAPADEYALLTACHGKGWLPSEADLSYGEWSEFSVGKPSGHNPIWRPREDALETRSLGESGKGQYTTALYTVEEYADALEATSIKFRYILFDACFMSNIESLYALRRTADHIVASPCEIMARGVPYHRVLRYMFPTVDSEADLGALCKAFYDFYNEEYSVRSGCISTTVCSELEALAAAARRIAESGTAPSDIDPEALQTYEGAYPHAFFDLRDYMLASCTDETLREDFMRQLDRTVINRYNTPEFYSVYNAGYNEIASYSGISTSAPSVLYRTEWNATEWAQATLNPVAAEQ